jgi:hypothetical protein
MPILIAIDIVLLSIAFFLHNPYQDTLRHQTWFSVLGILSLAYMAYIEKERVIPLRFLEKLSIAKFAVFTVAGLGALLFIQMISRGLWPEIPVYSWIIQLSSEGIGVVAFNFHVAIVEESFKVAFTNLFARLWHVQRKSVMRAIVLGWGTFAVAVWAYLHIVLRGHNLPYAEIAFVSGLAIFAMIYRIRNYVPTTIAHAFINILADFLPSFLL